VVDASGRVRGLGERVFGRPRLLLGDVRGRHVRVREQWLPLSGRSRVLRGVDMPERRVPVRLPAGRGSLYGRRDVLLRRLQQGAVRTSALSPGVRPVHGHRRLLRRARLRTGRDRKVHL